VHPRLKILSFADISLAEGLGTQLPASGDGISGCVLSGNAVYDHLKPD
jgi:hypothetical protein